MIIFLWLYWDWHLSIPEMHIVVTCITLLVLRPCVNHNKLWNNASSWVEHSVGWAIAMNDGNKDVIVIGIKIMGLHICLTNPFAASFFVTEALRETNLIEFSQVLVSKGWEKESKFGSCLICSYLTTFSGIFILHLLSQPLTYIQELLVSCL